MPIWRTVVQVSGEPLPDPGANIFHVRTAGPTSIDTDQALQEASVGLNSFYNSIKGLFPSSVTISHDGIFQTVTEAEPEQRDSGQDFTLSGTGTGGNLPAANCMIVTWRTALAARSGRGRSFIGPLVKSCAEDNGTPEESNRSALAGAAAALVDLSDNTEPAPWAYVVWSPTDNVGRDFTSSSVPNKFAVLRSRRD